MVESDTKVDAVDELANDKEAVESVPETAKELVCFITVEIDIDVCIACEVAVETRIKIHHVFDSNRKNETDWMQMSTI